MNTKIKGGEDKLEWEKQIRNIKDVLWKTSTYEQFYELFDSATNSLLLKQKKEILDLKCLKEEKHIENKTLQDKLRYKACYSNLDIDARNSLRLEIKNKIDKL